MAGSDNRPIVTTVAPTMPVLAANNAPTAVTASPKPPGARPNRSDKPSSNVSAMRERSNVTPMQMKSGTATSVWLVMIPNSRPDRKPKSSKSKTPNKAPPNANKSATPARVGATA